MNIYSVVPETQSKTDIFISKAKLIHGGLYNYHLVEYINNALNIKIVCESHGVFEQRPNNHLSGKGCKICAQTIQKQLLSSNTCDFIIKAKIIHEDLYNYDSVEYINSKTKIKIECKVHGIFEQTPNKHLSNKGCQKCNHSISKISTKWLESLNVQDMILEYRFAENTKKPVDGYSPSTNTVYQFHGDYWHGNPNRFPENDIHPIIKKTYGELYRKTIESDLWIQSLGYNLVTMWESDFKKC